MRILLFGGSGQLGSALRDETAATRHEMLSPSSSDVDLRDDIALRDYIASVRPELIVNAAAYTRVDDAETDSEAAYAVNARAPAVMASAAEQARARFIHISTDYVFDGEAGAPYAPPAAAHPQSAYGASKLAGERAALATGARSAVIRSAWVHSRRGTNFVSTAVRMLSSGRTMRVVDDQIGTPTRAAHLAIAITRLIERPNIAGLLHFTDAGVASWFDVATCALETLRTVGKVGDEVQVVPVSSAEFPRPARRPRVAVLDKHDSWAKIGWIPPHWRAGIIASIHDILDA